MYASNLLVFKVLAGTILEIDIWSIDLSKLKIVKNINFRYGEIIFKHRESIPLF